MIVAGFVLAFLAGALLCNAIPHLASGLRGEPFPTPFARPRGVGLSPPLVNFLWGSANLAVGAVLAHRWAVLPGHRVALAAGFLALGIHLSIHFGRVRG